MRLQSCVAVATFLFAGVAAHADAISVYSLQNQAATASYGTVTVDSTLGTVLTSSLSVVINGMTDVFSGAPGTQGRNLAFDEYQAIFTQAGNEFQLLFAATTSLVGYTPLDRAGCKNNAVRCDFLANVFNGAMATTNPPAATFEGNLVLTTATATGVTPEPASIALLGTGLLGMAVLVRRRLA